MKKILLLLVFSAILPGCSVDKQRMVLYTPGETADVKAELNNLKNGADRDELIVSGQAAKVTYLPMNGVWNLDKYVFIDCEVENLSDHIQLVELMINGDRWTMGGAYFEPGERKLVRSIIMRQQPTVAELARFPNMNGYPGGSIHLWWKSYAPDSIKSVALYLPLSEEGDIIKVYSLSAVQNFKSYTDKEYKELLPIVDEYGQYIHNEWPGKIGDKEALMAADSMELADLNANPGYTEMSKFGGWKNGPKLKATGHFRVEKVNEKWAIVDPEGFLFWSHGIDCVRPNSDTPVEGREQFYKFLPDSASEFKDFIYPGRVSSSYTPFSTGRINPNSVKFVNFYGMNLERKWNKYYKTKFIERSVKRLKSWEMNTIANWSDSSVYMKREIPYTINANTARNRMLTDPFDPGFGKSIENQLTAGNSRSLDDPWCLGIFIDNEIGWGNDTSIGSNVITTDRYPFARKAMINTLMKKYTSVSLLNKSWGSSFSSWNDLVNNREKFAGAEEDLKIFTGLFADEYFSKCKTAVKNVAPDLLYLGCRFDFHFYPDPDNLTRDWVIAHAGKFADVVSFNRYNYSCNTMKPVDGMDFPIILGEFHVGALDRGLPHSGLRHSTDQNERASVYKNFLLQAVSNPYIVGVGWFQYLDQPYTGRNDGENYQIGFITVGDYPNREIVESARIVGRNMYKLRYGNN